MTATTILLGNLRLVGEPRRAGNMPTVTVVVRGAHSTGDNIATMTLYPSEWQSLVHVAAVVEAAKEWRAWLQKEPGCGTAECELRDALDTLTEGGEK